MKTTPQISSISCIHQRGRVSLTAESMCWDTFSRYGATIQLAKHSLAVTTVYCEETESCHIFILNLCLCSREGHLLPLTEILALSWVWGLSSGFQRGWQKTSDKVEMMYKVIADRSKLLWKSNHCDFVCFPTRPRVCQLARYSVCSWPQQEGHLIHPSYWTEGCDWFWVSKYSFLLNNNS